MRVLWVSDEVPDPALGGGSIRQHAVLQHLAARIDCDVLLLGSWTDPSLRPRLGRVVEVSRPPVAPAKGGLLRKARSVRVALYARDSYEVTGTQAVRDALAPVLVDLVRTGQYDLVHFEHGYLAPLVAVVRAAGGTDGPACELAFQYLPSLRAAQTAAAARSPRDRLVWSAEARRGRRFEAGLGARFDRVIVVSDDDAALLPYPTTVVPNGVDLAAFPATPLPAEPRMLFSGSLGYLPNIDGATWFCREILPQIRRQVPDARLTLVGRDPADDVRALTDLDGVDAHFDVPAIQPYLQAARISVVPLRAGSGTRLKALEAMASGRPLAGTTIGLEGLGLTDGETAIIRNDAPSLARGIVELLTNDTTAERQRTAASALATAYDWTTITDHYLTAIGHEARR